jgi:DNA-binding protein H-NS
MANPTFQELRAQAEKLFAQAEQLRKEEIANVAKEVASKLNEYEITIGDLRAAGYAVPSPEKASAKFARTKKASSPTGTVAIKYRDPKVASNKWSGRGRTPKWMQAYLESGKKKDDFLIK